MSAERLLAWNGLALAAPADWELTALGPRHLVLSAVGGAVLECKWNRITGRFDLDRHVKKIAGSLGEVTPMEPPKALRAVLGEREVRAFSLSGGFGALLSCPVCRTVSLLRFAGAGAAEAATPARVLESLACHFDDGFVPWCVFGFRARTPDSYALTGHKLHPGRYELELTRGASRLILSSLGPADVLLAGRDLEAWSRETCATAIARHRLLPAAYASASVSLAWRAAREPGFGRRLFLRLRREPTRGGLIVRHDPAANRLFCLEASARNPLDWELMQTVEAGLGAVRE